VDEDTQIGLDWSEQVNECPDKLREEGGGGDEGRGRARQQVGRQHVDFLSCDSVLQLKSYNIIDLRFWMAPEYSIE
jgi:hypothetical protein